jgi:DNA-binding transcriptional LysR family regulator
MGDSKLKISQLQAFVAVADQGNFSLAALELNLSQSTVSHAIATLESDLGVVLFLRGRHGATLTAEGEQFIQEARQILQLIESIYKKANLAKGLQSGQVRVASVRSITTHVLPKIIRQFRNKFPTINVVISEYDIYVEVEQAIREGQADVGFTSLPVTAGFEVWELFQDEFVALLPPETIQPETTLTWEQLASYPMILNLRSPRHNQAVHDHFLQFGQTLKIDYEVREDSTILGMVQQGLGATVMARLVAEPIPEGIQIKSLPVPLKRTIGVIISSDILLPRTIFAFLDVIKEIWQEKSTFRSV